MSSSAEKTPPRPWFPFVWTGLLAGMGLLVQFSETDQGTKNTVLIFVSLLIGIGLSIWLIRYRGISRRVRWSLVVVPWLVLLGFFSLVELINNGDIGVVGWRWRLSAQLDERLALPEKGTSITDWQTTPQDYPRFLGNGYWAEIENVELATDWQANPPQELWRRKIGAGWSGFSIVGHYAITQEQRGPDELVACYEICTGEIVWTHSDPVRWDPNGSGALGGIGPRATPTIYDQRVITQGATGIVNCLDALTGSVLWSHDTLAENNTSNVMWGKAGSPLVVVREEGADMVVISVGGAKGRSLIAYDLESGEEIWAGGDRRSSYASPVLAELAGQKQIFSVNEHFITAHRVDDGTVLWEHPWRGNSDTNATCSQPIPLSRDRVFLSKGYGIGSSLLQLTAAQDDSIQVSPLWQPHVKQVMKTKMGNAVVRGEFMYGLDASLLECIEISTGRKRWKKRRTPSIGHGQILLIGEAILVLTETGEVLLVEASPKKYRELTSIRVFPEDQVTWNNPAFSAPYLLLRNAEQVACYELPLK
ncbi:MAG: PQQ-binding-like beta-propeller repeat protein [Planctomycetes bacterium]|nr:PQQ-binding-like beta-propeller repeat protein [Planctomycetota bacterium]